VTAAVRDASDPVAAEDGSAPVAALPDACPRHQEGMLSLAFWCDARGRTTLSAHRQRFPLRTTVPLYLDDADPGMAFVYVQNPTGGVFAGDRLTTRVAAGADARVHVTTQSATKLYRMDGGEAVVDLRFDVGAGAYVEHLPDPIIPQAGARLRQRTVVDLGADAAFVGAETIGPGRRARGESFRYELVELRTNARRAGRELCADTIRLEPDGRDPRRPGVLGGYEYLVTLLAIAPERDAEALARRLDDALARESAVVGAAGALPRGAGAMARALTAGPLEARRALLSMWREARAELAGLPLPTVRK
jgi:urease accessory protein